MTWLLASDHRQVEHARQLLSKPDPSGSDESVRRVGQLEVAVAGLLAIVDRITDPGPGVE